MYRVIAIVSGALLLGACSSSSSMFDFKSAPSTDAVRFESEPPGAEVRVGDQTCRTPCSLAVPTTGPQTATFALNGYQSETEQLELVTGAGPASLTPNPVSVEMTPAPPSARKPAAPRKKPAARPRAAAAPASSSSMPAAAPASPQAAAPWPTAPARQ